MGLYKEKYNKKQMNEKTDELFTYEKIVYRSLRIMFDPQPSDREWNEMEFGKVYKWFLYQSCGVHELRADAVTLYLLAEKDYPRLNTNKKIIQQMVKPGVLKCQRHYMSDHQAYKLQRKYDKILDPSIRKRFQRNQKK